MKELGLVLDRSGIIGAVTVAVSDAVNRDGPEFAGQIFHDSVFKILDTAGVAVKQNDGTASSRLMAW